MGQPAALGWWAVGRGLVADSIQAAGEKGERSEGAGSPCLQTPMVQWVCLHGVLLQVCQELAATPVCHSLANCGFSLACSRHAGSSHLPRGAHTLPGVLGGAGAPVAALSSGSALPAGMPLGWMLLAPTGLGTSHALWAYPRTPVPAGSCLLWAASRTLSACPWCPAPHGGWSCSAALDNETVTLS